MKQIRKRVFGMLLCMMLLLSICCISSGAAAADVTEVAAGKGGTENGIGTWDFDRDTIFTESNGLPISKLTDDDENTQWAVHGGGNHAMGAIDLGQKYKIHHVEVLAYNNIDPNRGANFDITLANTVPTSAETEASYTAAKLTLGTMPYRDDRMTADTGYDTFTVDYTAIGADAEGYRYVCLEELTDGVMYVAEVKVYIANSDMPAPPVQLTEVAAGKGGTENGVGTWDFSLDTNYTESNNWPISNLTDGDENTQWAVHGGGNHAVGWIDLGQAYTIHRVEVLAYVGYDGAVRGSNFDIAVSNTVPTSADTEASYTAAKLVLGTMPYREDRVDASTGYDSFTVDYTAAGADAGGYRYVCLEELTDGIMYVAEVKVYVEVGSQALSFANLTFNEAGGTLTVQGNITNGAATDTAVILVSGYDANDQFIKTTAREMTLATGVLSQAFSETVDVSALAGYARLDVAVVDNLAGMHPVLYIKDALTSGTPVATTATSATGFNMTAKQTMEGATVNGTAPKSPVMLTLLAKDASFETLTPGDAAATVLWSGLAETAADGSFSVDIPMDLALPTGSYALMAAYNGSTETASERKATVGYASLVQLVSDFQAVTAEAFTTTLAAYQAFYEDLMPALSAEGADLATDFLLAKAAAETGRMDEKVTGISQASDVRALLEAALLIHATRTTEDFDATVNLYKNRMPLIFTADYNGSEFETILNQIKAKESLDTAEALLNAYEKSVALCLILNGSYEERAKALTSYGAVLGIGSTTISASGVTPLEIAKQINSGENDIAGYLNGMDSRVQSIISGIKAAGSSQNGGYVSSGRGSGSGRGSSSNLEYYPVTQPSTETGKEPVQQKDSTPAIDTGKYEDLGSYDWAVPSILRLTDAGIVNGVSETSFEPGRALKREEAVKLLALSFGFAGGTENEVYADVSIDSWYHAYVDAASKNGVVNGIDRTHFGVGYTITRQDMAVMLYRALLAKGTDLSAEDGAAFNDMDAVADYAKEAVSALAAKGILNGISERIFAPSGEVTRAQAAVMLDRTLQQFGFETATAG